MSTIQYAPRYLILHGYHQSSEIISKKIKGLFDKNATFDIPTGPLVLEDGTYGWFPLDKIDLNSGIVTVDHNDISKVFECGIQGTYDAIIAFSQGCLTAALLVGSGSVITNKLLLFSPIPAPIVWPYVVKSATVNANVYIGQNDTLVSENHSLSFLPVLGDNKVEIIKHRWGHVICTTKAYKEAYHKFLTR